ncbi:hypothetical protein BLNAU_5829 [Blattamonas nauphoetae]|uniref:Uncharacterized protein n=1 Tax=Blattamonas nauphoetae TaxID=2049346 RepID=A0ABQ9Y6B5_9EUKA|nr:hypothetical protein BLNAU_5829 [Blattamonas nauphoetae]
MILLCLEEADAELSSLFDDDDEEMIEYKGVRLVPKPSILCSLKQLILFSFLIVSQKQQSDDEHRSRSQQHQHHPKFPHCRQSIISNRESCQVLQKVPQGFHCLETTS